MCESFVSIKKKTINRFSHERGKRVQTSIQLKNVEIVQALEQDLIK